jgi:hypothetical protein
MYQIIALELAPRESPQRWVIASGFKDARGADDTLRSWIARHYPRALHHEDSQLWLVEDRGAPQACYFIEMEEAVAA